MDVDVLVLGAIENAITERIAHAMAHQGTREYFNHTAG